jgi:hypothetical protein
MLGGRSPAPLTAAGGANDLAMVTIAAIVLRWLE